MEVSKTAVALATSTSFTLGGIVMLIRYQLKQSRPVDRRASSVAGSIVSQFESSKSAPPACGAKSYVLIDLPVGCLTAAAKRKRHIEALMGASRCARLNSVAHA